ncbi:hypothetical protein C9374_005985 [Naegleria lovaniensis]|uniref:Kinesin motor domain-containing protein n=1 Tax=Naegleria lovaniensis TaxID=51637 RepID=A0AA88GII1_NAELO|nr:uncharacterized protein C9374_014202 [Naegleria lovaniensis]XP_044547281.1 uncharacterized protein C9374_005985 [Naegleria lovaniensis]KAG2370787.1 hypothetical protein C9374_014202 [Naegleria lovaniensis]KAG2381601.1 hypothetical protein C9374_005985 [Naegleria lovaniensis]
MNGSLNLSSINGESSIESSSLLDTSTDGGAYKSAENDLGGTVESHYDHVHVCIRLAPVPAEESSANAQNIIEISDVNKLIAYHPESREGLLYKFDHCFDSETSNNEIFESVCVPLLNAVIEGYNGTIISYGSSRTGKTEMMIGNEREEGIVDLTFREGYSYLSSVADKVAYSISFSFWEMSNDTILDLLDPDDEKELKLKKHTKQGVFITNLKEMQVESWEQLQSLIDDGIRRSQKLTAQRKIRLHSFMRLRLTRNDLDHPEQDVSSSLMFVNLKGTERIGKMGAKGEHLKEGASLNKSLTAFGNAIHNVVHHTKVKGAKTSNVNINSLFGDSMVTAVLSEALGGKSASVIIGSISQTEFHYLETMEALENLRIARHISTFPKKQILNTKVIEILNRIKALEKVCAEDKLAPGHPPTEEQEKLESLKQLYRKYLAGMIELDDLSKSKENGVELQPIPDKKLPKAQLWKQNDMKSQRHGMRATVYKPTGQAGVKPKETYKGQWMDHQKHGYGEEDTQKFNYKGCWANGKKEGEGVLYSKEKSKKIYNGEWKNGLKHGKGIYYYDNGEIYEGDWANDMRWGYGTMYFIDGTKYEGEWANDKQHGTGCTIEKNGDRFEGSYLDGLKHGPGIYYYITAGQKYVGEWFKGVPKCGQLFKDVEYEESIDPENLPKDIPENKLLDRERVIEDAVTSVRLLMEQQGVLPLVTRENVYD